MANPTIPVQVYDRVYANPADAPIGLFLGPASSLEKLAKSGTLLTRAPKGLLVGVAGTANITDLYGVDHDNVPLQAGYNPISISKLRPGGLADDIWGLF